MTAPARIRLGSIAWTCRPRPRSRPRRCGWGLGNTSAIKWFDGIGEVRINWGSGYRIYLAKDGDDLIVLFGGGTKSTQRKDIVQAKALHAEYKARKRGSMKGSNLKR